MIAILLLIAGSLHAQTLTPSTPTSVQRGQNFTLTINAAGGTASGPAGVQWNLTLPAGWGVSAPATALANKSIACTPVSNLKCIVYGATVTSAIPNGPVATLTIAVPPLATLGAATITTSGTLGASSAGASIATAGGSTTITVSPDARDLNGDGIVDQSDVTAAVSQIFGTCTTADIAPPTGCDVVDLILITLKAQGQIP